MSTQVTTVKTTSVNQSYGWNRTLPDGGTFASPGVVCLAVGVGSAGVGFAADSAMKLEGRKMSVEQRENLETIRTTGYVVGILGVAASFVCSILSSRW